MLFNNKRGILEEPLWFLIDLIIISIVFYYSASYVDQITSTTIFEKIFLSKDIALLIDSLYASPEEIELQYPQNTLWFGYGFDHNKVSVFEKKLFITKRESYFMEDKNMGFTPVTLSPEKEIEDKSFINKYFSSVTVFSRKTPPLEEGAYVNIFLNKNLNELSISNEKVIYADKFRCPEIETKEDSKQKVLLIDQKYTGNE